MASAGAESAEMSWVLTAYDVEDENMICNRCTAAFQEANVLHFSSFDLRGKNDRYLQVLHPNFASLEAALKAKCGFCHRLVNALTSKKQSKVLSNLQLCPDVEPQSFSLRYFFTYESKKQVPLPDGPALEAGNGVNTPSMNTINFWIEKCHKNHPLCRRDRAPLLNRRFARILDVGDVPDAPDVRLCLADQLPPDVKYMTLSHCWGGATSKIPSLTTKTYEEYLQRIIVVNLPRTFRDAINLTRHLGIQYLWIDSLCIIQDSRSDWLSQADLMGEVYQGSYLNVAATKASNPTEGLFTSRNPLSIIPLRISIRGKIPDGIVVQQERHPLSSLRLEDATILVASHITSVEVIENELDLNTCLGNNNGAFDPNGRDFSFSGRNVNIVGTTLHAELRTIRGEWKSTCIGLKGLVEGISVRSSPRLVSGSTLLYLDSKTIEPRLDLNKYLGNNNGAFDIDGENFALSAKCVSLTGTTLEAELKAEEGGWRLSSIDLSSFINWSSGRFCVDKSIDRKARIFYDVDNNSYLKFSEQVTVSKLCTRGWVFQERLLAPRVVHFAKQQLFWECVSSQGLEEKPSVEVDHRQACARNSKLDFKTWDLFSDVLLQVPVEKELGLNYIWTSIKAMYGRDKTPLCKENLAQDANVLQQARQLCFGENKWTSTHPLIRYWSMFISSYSRADLTYIEDRLVAIAGLARILSSNTGLRYAAGLWVIQLPRQLLWNFAHSGRQPKQIEKYVAPSWSWASNPGILSSRGLQLEPILETMGAMDLIKVLSIDVQGVMQNDTMPFGQVKSGLLRIRGRLLPISLDLRNWPVGVIQKDKLVQFWTGSTPEVPTGETFLVPVLFTLKNERLPDATPNSLLLESTGTKGIFCRIGTARLSSLCDLVNIVPQLYAAQSIHYEDEDDDADSEGGANEENTRPINTPASGVKPSPQQEYYDRVLDSLASEKMQKGLTALQDKIKNNATRPRTGSASNQNLARAMNGLRSLSTMRNAITSQIPGRPKEKGHFNSQEIQAELQKQQDSGSLFPAGTEIEVKMRNNMWTKKNITKLKPKEAIASHFYTEHIEEDEDVVRYGHFTFGIC
ncbi:hypothetical protein B7494_g7719 [Chlorociboria aeruginascens]|nr:hypothetical protein B7494_g7719 [Chlorociboria aeruginascens]